MAETASGDDVDTQSTEKEIIGQLHQFGSGDSYLVPDLFDSEFADAAFQKLCNGEADWSYYKQQSEIQNVSRLVAMQAAVTSISETDSDGTQHARAVVPIYRFFTHRYDHANPFTPSLLAMIEQLDGKFQELGFAKQTLNHCIIGMYRTAEDHITEHTDKTLDIEQGTLILNVSLGAHRTLVLKSKFKVNDKQVVQKVPMPHNSMFVLGPRTNREWTHVVQPDKRPQLKKTAAELAFGCVRVSLTFRSIATFLYNDRILFGQGARSKTLEEAKQQYEHRPDVQARVEEAAKMQRCFGRENKDLDFDWQLNYAEGFDVLDHPSCFL